MSSDVKLVEYVPYHEVDGFLKCAQCNDCYTSPIGVITNAGGSITIVDSNGTRMRAGALVGCGHGVCIDTVFVCETGRHIFAIRSEFAKGITTHTVLPDYDWNGPRLCIWRD